MTLALALATTAAAAPATLEADRVVLTPELLEAEQGRWSSDGWRLDFDEAVVSEGQVTLAGVRLTGCETDPPAWSLRSHEVVWKEDRLVLRRGVLELGSLPVVPVPRLSLPTRSRTVRPLLPELGYGDDGARVVLPVAVSTAAGELQVAPGVRSRRGPQLGLQLAGTGGHVEALGAWEAWRGGDLRGLLQSDAAVAGPGWSAAVLGAVASDRDVLDDFALDALGRSTPWLEQRALLALGPLSVHHLGWQDDDGLVGRPGATVEAPVLPLGPLRGRAGLSLDAVGEEARLATWVGAEDLRAVGPVELRLAGAGRSLVYGSDQVVDGLADATLLVPVWADHGRWVHELAVGGRGAAGARTGELEPRLVADEEPGPPAAGPWLESHWWRPAASVRLAGGLLRSELGWRGAMSTRVASGPWSLHGQLDADGERSLYGGRVGWDDGLLDLGLTSWHADGLLTADQVGVDATVDVVRERGTWRPTGEALASPGQVEGWRLGLGWSSPCGCLEVGAKGGLDHDQRLPQVLAWLDLSRG